MYSRDWSSDVCSSDLRSGPPAGRFRAKVSENPIFRCNSIAGSLNCEPSVPTSYYTLMGIARVGFGILAQPFPILEPPAGRFRAKVSEYPTFWCNSLTGSPNCEPSVPTSYFTPMGSAHASFGFFPLPFPFSEPRRAVFEPKCSKNSCFGEFSNRESYFRTISSYNLLYPRGSARAGFGFFPLPFPFPDPRRAVFEPKCSKNPVYSV